MIENRPTIEVLQEKLEALERERETLSQRIAALQAACDYAILVIKSYELDILRGAWVGVDLVKAGFCQGDIYRTAIARIEEIAEGK